MLYTYRFYSSYFVSQTFRESLIFFFTGTIPTIRVAIVPIVARRYSFTCKDQSHKQSCSKNRPLLKPWQERTEKDPWRALQTTYVYYSHSKWTLKINNQIEIRTILIPSLKQRILNSVQNTFVDCILIAHKTLK